MPEISPELQQMRAALDAATRRESTANQRATQAQTELHQERGGRLHAQELAIDAQIRTAEETQTALEREWADLQAEGKLPEAASAMRKMTEASSLAINLKGQKQYLAQQRDAVSQQQPTSTDPLANFNDSEKTWIRNNPSYLEDPAFQRKANAAAVHAYEVLGIVKDSPEYFEHITKTMYPDRQQQQQQPAVAGDLADNNLDDQPRHEPVAIALDNTPLERRQEHTLEASPVNRTQVAPELRIILGENGEGTDQVRQNPYTPAVGRGARGEAMRSVAAVPSRNIDNAARRALGGRTEVTMTQEEQETAIALASSIEPDSEMVMRNDVPRMLEWYIVNAKHASNLNPKVRRSSWARDAIIG